jgi:hypothetical protein
MEKLYNMVGGILARSSSKDLSALNAIFSELFGGLGRSL